MNDSDLLFIIFLPLIFIGAIIFGAIFPLFVGIDNPYVMLICFGCILTFGVISLFEELFK